VVMVVVVMAVVAVAVVVLVGSRQPGFSWGLQVKFSRLEIPALKFIIILWDRHTVKHHYFHPPLNIPGPCLLGEATRLRWGCLDLTGAESFIESSWYILECHQAGLGPGN